MFRQDRLNNLFGMVHFRAWLSSRKIHSYSC